MYLEGKFKEAKFNLGLKTEKKEWLTTSEDKMKQGLFPEFLSRFKCIQ